MSKLDKEQVLADFTEAYTSAHGKAPTVEEKSGWYSINGDKNVRLAQVAELTEELKSGSVKSAKKPTAAKSTSKKTSTKAKTSSKKASKGKSSGGLTAKELWKQHLEKSPDARLPRGMQ
ncbi:hypothetical protein CWE08_03740 [Aliidiomarina iranensis]|uniref:Uncharacterized protein n=1 Tax=Aliidiomarina iranensis TaxID=1434071 RepID=A0A432VZW6_9GAMM|nr:hypothetical protein [Aliidiomarina iranensis]RUO22309.1 hypothetical protein CWE08_03740 [Aliidiomarina iranensis]